VREQELRVLDQAFEPFLLQMTRREVAQQHRDFPVLHQLVGKARIPARDLLGDQRKRAHLALGIELEAAEFLRHAQRADPDLFGALQDFGRQTRLRIHVPFPLPVGADEGGDDLVDEITAALAHQALLFGEAAPWGDVEHDDFPD
jgi:hypothetical protein